MWRSPRRRSTRPTSGINVEVVFRDSGDTTTDIATVSVTDLLSQDVSAIVGAASSGVSFTVIDQITAAGVVQFSPANTSPDFTDYEDNGLYFRTAPSDLLQGEVLGNADRRGRRLDARPARPERPVRHRPREPPPRRRSRRLAARSSPRSSSTRATRTSTRSSRPSTPRTPTPSPSSPSMRPRSSFPRSSARATPATSCTSSTATWPTTARTSRPASSPARRARCPVRTSVRTTSASACSRSTPTLTDYSYGRESYDAPMLIALAAYAANSTEGADIAEYLRQVSGGTR